MLLMTELKDESQQSKIEQEYSDHYILVTTPFQ